MFVLFSCFGLVAVLNHRKMAKRPLGLGKRKLEKKRKVQEDGSDSGSNSSSAADSKQSTPVAAGQIQIELEDDVDPDSELGQLEGLWLSYFDSDRENEMVLNGVVHECDRLLREANKDASVAKTLDDKFYSIYALALSELAIFKAGEDESKKSVSEFFDDAIERVELGQQKHAKSQILDLVMAKILLQRLPLEYISSLKVDSKSKDGLNLTQLLKDARNKFNIVKSQDKLTFEVLQMMNDLLDIVENFGHEDDIEEGLDSDNEDELEVIELTNEHPLYEIQQDLPANYKWLKSNLVELLNTVEKDSRLYKSIVKTLGELYLKDAEAPTATFMKLQYGDDDENEDNKESKQAQREAMKLTAQALEYLEKAQIEDDPKTWVQVAEAHIDFGNLQDFESEDQEKSYKTAEKILKKANRATNGKFQHILDNLLNN